MPPEHASYARARAMRSALTPPEARLWACLRGRRLGGLKFRRQHPIGPFILDFYCPAARLAVEVDGQGHDDPGQMRHDARRTAWLARERVEVLRVSATDVRDELDAVLATIAEAAGAR